MKRKAALLFALFTYLLSSAQLQYYSPNTLSGYTLFQGDKLYLINNCGEQIHTWEDINPNFHVKLLPNGNIVYIDWGTGEVIEKNWEDQIVNAVMPLDPKVKLDYEVIVTPENNYLCVARYKYSQSEFIATGYNTDVIGNSSYVDAIVEIDRNTGATIWIWDIMDHVIQERSDTIGNYGIVGEHPELLNLDAISTLDWQFDETFMINGMDYNATLDQIVCSLRKMGEIVIIDHSTTIEEAASHQGGNSGKGGDLLYRWGNPQNYGRGTAEDQQLYYQHNPNWIYFGEHNGGLTMFDNGLDRPGYSYGYDYSTAPIIKTPILNDNSYALDPVAAFEPTLPVVSYGGQNDPNSFNSRYTSSAKVLENENILVSPGGENRVLEFQPDGTLVWEYNLANANFTFRVEKYGENYPAFDGRDLSPMGTIEFPSSTVPCDWVSNVNNLNSATFDAWVDMETSIAHVKTNRKYQTLLYSMDGRLIWSDIGNGNKSFQLPNCAPGIYYLSIVSNDQKNHKNLKVFLPN